MEVDNAFSKKLIPYTTFCCKSIKSSLQQFVKGSDFEELCESWKLRETKPNICKMCMMVEYGMSFVALHLMFSMAKEITVLC